MPFRLCLVSALVFTATADAQFGGLARRRPDPPPIVITPTMPAAFRLLTAPAVQKDVGLTGPQIEAVEALAAEWALPADSWHVRGAGWLTPVQGRAETARRTAAFLAKTLTREQARRADQIAYQLREKEFGAHVMFARAAGELGLRPDQADDLPNIQQARVEEIIKHVTSGERFAAVKPKVVAANADTYEKMAEMLTRTQRDKLKELRGKAFDGTVDAAVFNTPAADLPREKRRSVYPPESFGEFDYELEYLKDPKVQKELKGADDQIVGWNRITLPNPDERMLDKTLDILREHLTNAQFGRFHQLMMRRRLVLGGMEAVCGYPAAVEKLGLTGFQLQQLKSGSPVAEVLTADQQKMLPGLPGEAFEFDRVERDAFFESFRQAKEKKAARPAAPARKELPHTLARSLLSVPGQLQLTEDQIKKLREIAEDAPLMKELIDKEFGYPDAQHTIGADRNQWSVHALQARYTQAAEAQAWKVLDAKQQSMAKKLMGRD